MIVKHLYTPYELLCVLAQPMPEMKELCSLAIENFNEYFKDIFDGDAQAPTKGLIATGSFALEAILVYQLAAFNRFEHGLRGSEVNVGLKPFLKAA